MKANEWDVGSKTEQHINTPVRKLNWLCLMGSRKVRNRKGVDKAHECGSRHENEFKPRQATIHPQSSPTDLEAPVLNSKVNEPREPEIIYT